MVDDKFIMMGLNDERSKKIAEVMGNKTCKKMIDFLADTKEASEKDIADALDMKLNTVEYNLKKLLASGLVEKSKTFFWSKRGKKIPMYKLAKKHIIISPKARPNMAMLKTIIPVIAAIAFIALAINLINTDQQIIDIDDLDQSSLKTFSSRAELEQFLKENQDNQDFYGGNGVLEDSIARMESGDGAVTSAVSGASSAAGGSTGSIETESRATDFSETNIQVEGVDEPDIVKNDGKYIYVVSGQKVVIINAFPADSMEVLSEIESKGVRDIFVNGDKLVIFGNEYSRASETTAKIYDITDRENPVLDKEIAVDGNYVTARMIGDNIYLVANQYVNRGGVILPGIAVNGMRTEIAVSDISYFPYPDRSYTFTNILAIDIDDGEFESQTYLTGASHTIYVSEDNIYLTYSKRISNKIFFEEAVEDVFIPLVPGDVAEDIRDAMDSDKEFREKQREVEDIITDYSNDLRGQEKGDFDKKLRDAGEDFQKTLAKKIEVTIIHKIGIDGLDIEYKENGEVPGHLLNQFSMDEFEGNFRVATTTGNTWGQGNSLNHMYVLDEDLKVIGSVDDLAEGERIYSVRFMGKRAYMVTFRQVDPLFVIDLSDPENPEVLGQLKVTGFSSYLHPYDENHIIGIGKEATEQGRVQGVKIAIFDVSDVENPIETAKYEVDKRWSDSNALYDHKAFLFDKEKNLLVLPMSYSEKTGVHANGYDIFKNWQGAFVFNIASDEISLRGKIDHMKDNTDNRGYYYSQYAVQRSLYMDDTLYTISRTLIKANELDDLTFIDEVELPYSQGDYPVVRETTTGGVGVGVVLEDDGEVSISTPVTSPPAGRGGGSASVIKLN